MKSSIRTHEGAHPPSSEAEAPVSAPAEASPSPAPPANKDEDEEHADDGAPKILSKKEKEKLKKEREKVSETLPLIMFHSIKSYAGQEEGTGCCKEGYAG